MCYTNIQSAPGGVNSEVHPMSIHIDLGQWNSVFAVPSSVADRHLKLASEAQLKVLLYLLRHAGDDIPEDGIAQATGVSADEVHNGIAFWIERGLLRANGAQLTPAEATGTAPAEQPKAASQTEPKKNQTVISRAVRPDSVFVSKAIREDKNLAGLMEEAQSVLHKPLSPGDAAVLVMLYDTFGLPCEVIAMLLHYLTDTGRGNIRAVERVGISWSDNGVCTVEAAEREIERASASREAWGRVSALFGIRNAGHPTQSQLASADRWLNEWGFNDEMVNEAYERCVDTKGEYNMSYINAILKKWYEKRIFSLDALKEAESRPSAARGSKKPNPKGSVFSADGASFDLEKYEKQSLFDD